MPRWSILPNLQEGPYESSSPDCRRLAARYYRISICTGILGTAFFPVLPIAAILAGAFTPVLMIWSGTLGVSMYLIYNRYSTFYTVFKEAEFFRQSSAKVNLIYYLKKGGRPYSKVVFYLSIERITVISNSEYLAIMTKPGESYYVLASHVPDVDRLLRDAEAAGARIERV